MTTQWLLEDVEAEEGRVNTAYPDPKSPLGKACGLKGIRLKDYRSLQGYAALSGKPWTVGCGFTGPEIGPSTVMTNTAIDAELQKRVDALKAELDEKLPWWTMLSDARQDVLVQMAFQMGIHGLLGFPHALEAMQAGHFTAARDHMLDSDWARSDSPARAMRMANQMATDERAWA